MVYKTRAAGGGRCHTAAAVSFFRHETVLLRQLKGVDMRWQYNKIANLRLAAERLNGIAVRPGETFSFWKLVGKPTYKKVIWTA